MSEQSPLLSVKPIITYPREAQAGKTYLMTIDLEVEESFEWTSQEEEYPIYCQVDSDLFRSIPVNEPALVLHRFGGSYGVVRFLLTAVQREAEGKIRVILINKWGVPVKVFSIEKVKVKQDLTIISDKVVLKSKTLKQKQISIVNTNISELNAQIDILVRDIRDKVQKNIQIRCGTIRGLYMSVPIGLEDIYTDVNILENITGRRRLNLTELQEIHKLNIKEFDRLGWRKVQERISGLTAVEKYPKLMVLGKPGAGKTTFLKHLAIRCIRGVFQPDRVPFFVSLKEFAETSDQPDLFNYMLGLYPLSSAETDNFTSLQMILQDGKALILLDGLDEVKKDEEKRICQEIAKFSTQFLKNQFVITCRIAAKEYTFEQFKEVEIADFDDAQIANFANKWLASKNDSKKAQRFLHKLKENEPIKELATSPILLTLLCLAFEDCGSFPPNRSELYKNGLDVLLKKWDTTRNIERDDIYKKLPLKHKEDLLSQIAYSTFTICNYFFKQKEAERQIAEYIQNFLDASTDPKILEFDSEVVLKSIEAQHGLLVERARNIYSFSHLTFHEYFTARQIVNSCNPDQLEDEKLQELVSHLTEKRWREVFLLTVGMLPNADCLLRLMKKQIDRLLARDEQLQKFLQWVDEQSQLLLDTASHSYKLAAIRANYLDFDIALDPDRTLGCLLDFPFTRVFTCASFLSRATGSEISETFHDVASQIDLSPYRALEPALAITFERAFAIILLNMNKVLDPTSKLGQELEYLKDQLPESAASEKELRNWWENKGRAWGDRLRAIIVPYRSLGGNWRFDEFSEEQKDLLKQYYYANLLLVACLNSDCYVSQNVRQEIEETLLSSIF